MALNREHDPMTTDPHAAHWAAIAEAAQRINCSEHCGPEHAEAFCAAIDRLSDALMSEASPEPRDLLPPERACCGTFAGSEHRATCPAGKASDDTAGPQPHRPRAWLVEDPDPNGPRTFIATQDMEDAYSLATDEAPPIALYDQAALDAAVAAERERKAPQCARIELVVALHTLASHYENALGAFGDDDEGKRKAEGDIAHAMKVAARHNYNGPGCKA